MKRKLAQSITGLIAFALSFGVVGCSFDSISSKEQESQTSATKVSSDSSSVSSEAEIHYMNVSLRNWYDERPQTDYILGFAHLWYEGETLGTAFKDVIEPRVLVAGDVFHFSFTGEVADSIMVIPSRLDIWGEVIDYEFIKTTMEKVEPESGSLIDILNSMYQIDEPYVILNQQGAYTSLEKYEGNKVYITLDYKKMYIDVDRNDSRQYGPSLPIAAAIYAFDPRKS